MMMKKAILAAVCVALLPGAAFAATLTANLSGADGTGIATVMIDGDTIDYTVLVSGLVNPSIAFITDGSTTVDLGASFTGGSATGSATNAAAGDIAANPSAWLFEVSNGTQTIMGPLMGSMTGGDGVVLYHPAVAKVPGLAGSNFVTDVRMVNRSGSDAVVTIDYYEQGAAGHASPSESVTITIPDGAQQVVNDLVGGVFGLEGSQGAVVVTSDMAITSSVRIYDTGADGTYGQYNQGLPLSHGWMGGTVPFLANVPASEPGFRANIGWFNPNAGPVDVTFTAYDSDGTMLDSTSATANGYAQQQLRVSSLFSGLGNPTDFYITYSADANLFVYGSVVDNGTNDAIFVPAIP
jgi:hypothetical protein